MPPCSFGHRDSFANIVDLLDDMFERAATAEEPASMNFIKKHSMDLKDAGVDRTAARLFSNPPGDFGSMVNEVVGSGDWEDETSLGETWTKRNSYSYGRNEGDGKGRGGTIRPEVLDMLLNTTERVVQEIDSVEYGLTDIQEVRAIEQHLSRSCCLATSVSLGALVLPSSSVLCEYWCSKESCRKPKECRPQDWKAKECFYICH
jgi:cobalamin biosynthesis Mg chelatase CobN